MSELTPQVYYMIYLALRLHEEGQDVEDQLGITLPMIAHVSNLSLEDTLHFTESVQEALRRERIIQQCARALPDKLTYDGPIRRFGDHDWIVHPTNFTIIIEGPIGWDYRVQNIAQSYGIAILHTDAYLTDRAIYIIGFPEEETT